MGTSRVFNCVGVLSGDNDDLRGGEGPGTRMTILEEAREVRKGIQERNKDWGRSRLEM